MNTPKPIKRSPELRHLSRDHHDGLLLCWKIRNGIKKQIEPERIRAYVLCFFENDLEQHFMQEEKYLFSHLSDTDVMKGKAIRQHENIRSIIQSLVSDTKLSNELLEAFANELELHIRYEERELFNYIEQTIPFEKLNEIGIVLNDLHKQHCGIEWEDEFWINEGKS
jgi:iron-sulfur cluster repair protein YtfE (RIC family)